MPSESESDADSLDSKKKICKVCSESIRAGGIKCNTIKCSVTLHAKCFELVAKIVYIDKSTWRCKACVKDAKQPNNIMDADYVVLQKENECLLREKELLNKLVYETAYSNKLQKTRIEELETKTAVSNFAGLQSDKSGSNSNHISYSSAVKKLSDTTNSTILLVKTKDTSTSNKQLELDIKSKIKPSAINANIVNTRLIKDGLLINCANEESLNNLKSNLSQQTGTTYNISEAVKLNPRLIIYSVAKDSIECPDLIENIINDNNLNTPTNEVKFVTKLKYRENFYNIVLEVSPSLFKLIINKGFLYVGWRRCGVKEHFHLPRCFKCSKYGHFQKACKSKDTVCSKCSLNHEFKDCNSNEISCNNCKYFNFKFKLNVPITHPTNDPLCNFRKFKLEELKTKICYE